MLLTVGNRQSESQGGVNEAEERKETRDHRCGIEWDDEARILVVVENGSKGSLISVACWCLVWCSSAIWTRFSHMDTMIVQRHNVSTCVCYTCSTIGHIKVVLIIENPCPTLGVSGTAVMQQCSTTLGVSLPTHWFCPIPQTKLDK